MNISVNSKLTKFNDVNRVLDLLSQGLKKILGKKLIALYLTGSLTYGGFDYGSSDIDFLAVLKNKLTAKEFRQIKQMHKIIAEKVPYWAKRTEGSYIPKSWLANVKKPKEKRPYVNAGVVSLCKYGNEWIINLSEIHQYGIVLLGPSPKNIISRVGKKDLQLASKKNLMEEWAPKLKERNPFVHKDYESSHLQTYAILTMCRILYTAKNGKTVSKKVASRWVKKNYTNSWKKLVEKAENWKHGKVLNLQNEKKDFIKFVIKEVQALKQ